MTGRAASLAVAVAMTAAALWLFLTPETVVAFRGALSNARWPLLAGAMLLSAAVQWLRAWRFAIMTTGAASLPDATLVGIAFQLNFYNFILPFRLGELSYPVLMRRAYDQPVLNAAGVLLLARLLDLCTVSALLLLTAAWLGLSVGAISAPALGVLGAALASAPFVCAGMMRSDFSLPRRASAITAGLPALRSPTARLLAVVLSFAIWLTFGGLAILAARAVVEGFPPATAMLGAAATNLAFALPVNGIAGLGPAQAAWILAVSQAGVAWNEAVITALSVYAVVLSSALLFGGLAMARTGWAGRHSGVAGDANRNSRLDKPLA